MHDWSAPAARASWDELTKRMGQKKGVRQRALSASKKVRSDSSLATAACLGQLSPSILQDVGDQDAFVGDRWLGGPPPFDRECLFEERRRITEDHGKDTKLPTLRLFQIGNRL
jgi:hypothetical protein